MKKLFIIMTVMSVAFMYAPKSSATPSPAPDYEQCSYFGNVSASIGATSSRDEIWAVISNGNDNAVMVHWEIKAYDSLGRYVTIGSGQIKVPGGQTRTGYRIPTSGYSGWGIKIYNCN